MGMLTGAVSGFIAGGPVGAVIGGLGGALSSGISAGIQRDQDIMTLERANTGLSLQLGQAEGLAAINTRQIEDRVLGRMGTGTAQASRYSAQQGVLATQTEESAARQMTIMGMQAQNQNAQANQQFIDMQFSGSQAIGQSQQRAAVSGLRGTGSVGSAQAMQKQLLGRQVGAAQKQLERGRASVSSQLEHSNITATQAASQLRAQGAERITATEEANALLRMDADTAKETVAHNLQSTRDRINQETDWNKEDLDWLDNEGLWATIATTLI